jgi:hypothetical protein
VKEKDTQVKANDIGKSKNEAERSSNISVQRKIYFEGSTWIVFGTLNLSSNI